LSDGGAAVEADQTETVLYRFKGGADGDRPFASLVADAKGVRYGTTQRSGTGCGDTGCGTIFRVVP
jgi:hypothetical protein